jgi:hypothetical protein
MQEKLSKLKLAGLLAVMGKLASAEPLVRVLAASRWSKLISVHQPAPTLYVSCVLCLEPGLCVNSQSQIKL